MAAKQQHDFPRAPLVGAAALIAITIAAVGGARLAGFDARVAAPGAEIVETRALHFADRSDGSVAVLSARDRRLIETVEPGSGGFLRATLRGLVRERRRHGIGAEAPFEVTRFANGRLALADPATGLVVELRAFGVTNAGVFAQLLSEGSVAR